MVDYEELKLGRRRNWWKKPEERKQPQNAQEFRKRMEALFKESSPTQAPSKSSISSLSEPASTNEEDFGLPDVPPDLHPVEIREAEESEEFSDARPKRRVSRRRETRERREQDLREWRQMTRRVGLGLAIGGIALGLAFWVYSQIHHVKLERERKELNQLLARAEQKEVFFDLSTPIHTLASYKNAWVRGI